jgi:hypothetical protein
MRAIIIKHALPPGVSTNALQRVTPGSINQCPTACSLFAPTQLVCAPQLYIPGLPGVKSMYGFGRPKQESSNMCYFQEYQPIPYSVLLPGVSMVTTHSIILVDIHVRLIVRAHHVSVLSNTSHGLQGLKYCLILPIVKLYCTSHSINCYYP